MQGSKGLAQMQRTANATIPATPEATRKGLAAALGSRADATDSHRDIPRNTRSDQQGSRSRTPGARSRADPHDRKSDRDKQGFTMRQTTATPGATSARQRQEGLRSGRTVRAGPQSEGTERSSCPFV